MITIYFERNFSIFNKLIVIGANIEAKILKVLNIYFMTLRRKNIIIEFINSNYIINQFLFLHSFLHFLIDLKLIFFH